MNTAVTDSEEVADGDDIYGVHPVFDYDDHGPQMWQEAHEQCRGSKQAPVDLRTENAVARRLPPLLFHQHWHRIHLAVLTNSGHSAKVSVDNWEEPAMLSGGPLHGRYVFGELHFHWGADSTEGSEHTLDGRRFSMEAHLVYYKQEYGSLHSATRQADGVAAVAFFLQVAQATSNAQFELLTVLVPCIQRPKVRVELPWAFAVEWLCNAARPDSYYTYFGSFTTPPCSEVITWIVYPEPISISEQQVAVFRTLRTKTESLMTRNYRPPQPLHNRELVYAEPQAGGLRLCLPKHTHIYKTATTKHSHYIIHK